MRKSFSIRWLVVAASAAMLLILAAACGTETVEVPGETVVVEKEVIKEVQVPGETVVVEKEVVKTVEVPGETVVKEVVKEVMVPGETVVVEKEVVKTVEVPGQTVVVEKEVLKEVEGERYVRNVNSVLAERPQYGGSLVVPLSWGYENFNPGTSRVREWAFLVFEELTQIDYTLPRDQHSLQGPFMTADMMSGEIAESWEVSSDLLTYTFNVRDSIHWHDKAPMNGRRLNAGDVVWTWQKHYGLGEFEGQGKNPTYWRFTAAPLETVTATDENTVVFQMDSPNLESIEIISGVMANDSGYLVLPKEVYDTHGDMSDWENVVGSGPYQITDNVPNSALTLTRNANYWKTDHQFPDLNNQLPYIEEVKILTMPDVATQIAALRTGKVAVPDTLLLTLPMSLSLQKSNPELRVIFGPGDQLTTPAFRRERSPFDEKNVRIAMQKAINLQELNWAYYDGVADPIPMGNINPVNVEVALPYAEWPEEVKRQYEYDPAEAERLLDEAGYRRGDDGIRFSVDWTNIVPWGEDVDLNQLVTSYFDAIGVDVTIQVQSDDTAGWNSYVDGTAGEIVSAYARGYMWNPMFTFGRMASTDYVGVTDPTFDAMFEKARASTDRDEYIGLLRDMNMYYIEQMWTLAYPIPPYVFISQPWVKGHNGEQSFNGAEWLLSSGIVEWWWIDQELKRDMGH